PSTEPAVPVPAKVLTTQAMLSGNLQDAKRVIRAKTRILLFIISHYMVAYLL
ncbi:hypothetical protein S1OALGB6SA_1961, partial [Olavius algarvensis spirochete endosymbiont]